MIGEMYDIFLTLSDYSTLPQLYIMGEKCNKILTVRLFRTLNGYVKKTVELRSEKQEEGMLWPALDICDYFCLVLKYDIKENGKCLSTDTDNGS